MVCLASAGPWHRQLSLCPQASPPPPDLGQMQGAEPVPSPKGAAVMVSDLICLTSPPQHSAKVLTNVSPSKPPRWWHFSQAIATEGLWAGPWDAPALVVPFLPSSSLTPGDGSAAPLQWGRGKSM